MSSAARSLWAEPRASGPPRRVARDWFLVAVLVPTAVVEVVVRDNVAWPFVAFAVCLLAIAMLLSRRTQPLAAVAVAFGSFIAAGIAAFLAGTGEPVGLDTSICAVVLVYALSRWGSGREAAIG